MIDNFALALSHGLLILAAWRLLFRDDLDDDAADIAQAGRKSWLPKTRRRQPETKDAPGA